MLPRLFDGGTCYILGGGASLTRETCALLPADQCIAINSTIKLKPTAAVLYFSDFKWFRDHRPIFDQFSGHVVTASVRAKRILARDAMFHLVRPPTIPSDRVTSGHCAVQLAVNAFGARRIILLGFDCKLIDGRSHNHDDYPRPWSDRLYSDGTLPMWRGWGERMARHGVTVLNCSPDSALTEFPTMPLDEALADGQARFNR
jgi:hypothetical protein